MINGLLDICAQLLKLFALECAEIRHSVDRLRRLQARERLVSNLVRSLDLLDDMSTDPWAGVLNLSDGEHLLLD